MKIRKLPATEFVFPIQMVLWGIKLWLFCIGKTRQWLLACRATHLLLVYIWLIVQTQLCTFLIINQQSDKEYIAECRQQPIQISNTLWILCQHVYLLFAAFCLKIPMLFHFIYLFVWLFIYLFCCCEWSLIFIHLTVAISSCNGYSCFILPTSCWESGLVGTWWPAKVNLPHFHGTLYALIQVVVWSLRLLLLTTANRFPKLGKSAQVLLKFAVYISKMVFGIQFQRLKAYSQTYQL